MEGRAKCADCGALNRADADFCVQCYTRPFTAVSAPSPVERGGTSRAVPAMVGRAVPLGSPASAQPPPISMSFQSFDEPLKPVRPPEAVVPAPMPSAPLPPPKPGRSRVIRWGWPHLVLFGFCAWGVPRLLGEAVPADSSLTQLLDVSLVLQIVGYLLAGIAIFVMVKKTQGRDWASLGIERTPTSGEEALRGFGFGLFLLALWSPVAYFLSGGHFSIDAVLRTLVGETSGVGLLLASVVVVIGAPVIEEIYYRGMLYEKLARHGPLVALVGTSLLFVMAHGAILIPPLLLLGFGLGFKRRTKSLWYTMAAHGGWNLAVLFMATVVVFSPGKTFSPPDDTYTLRHVASWQRHGELEMDAGRASVDLALEAADGSFVMVIRVDMLPGASNQDLPGMLKNIQTWDTSGMKALGTPRRAVSGSPEVSRGWELRTAGETPEGLSVEGRMVAVIPDGWEQALVFQFGCPVVSCGQSQEEFDTFLTSFEPAL